MDMKKILQNFDSAASRPKAESSDMKKFLSIVSEAAKDLDTTKTESGLQYHIGKKKYGKEGMKKLAQAGQDGASEEELGRIKDKYKKEDLADITIEAAGDDVYTITNPDLERDAETGREEPDQIEIEVDWGSYVDELEINKVVRIDTGEDITDKVLNNRQLYFNLVHDIHQREQGRDRDYESIQFETSFKDYFNLLEAKKKMQGKDPCWKGYKMVGTKKKGGREVPNCVPGKKGD